MIRFDLHIHSFASKYKESSGIVDASTIENASVLMTKLQENNVGLFSITDHNRFWPELYQTFDDLISAGTYPNVKGIVAGVEFDVLLDPGMKKCHIITIFDAENKIENYKKIQEAIEAKKLDDAKGSYDKKDYEDLLRSIGLDVILIACQRTGLDKHEGNHSSLSESTMEPEMFLSVGYINALEFQRPNVEGILRNNLKELPQNIMLVMGSDCHEWASYPDHDRNHPNPKFSFSKANILPSFKGLLMAVTSPETRINRNENTNSTFIQSISIGGVEYPLRNGLNAIIGENGSGKSTILRVMHGDTSLRYVKKIKEENQISCDSGPADKRLFLAQGQIVEQFEKNELFPQTEFASIDHNQFRGMYTKFATDVLSYIRRRIKAKEAIDQLSKKVLPYNEIVYEGSYFVNVYHDSDFEAIDNPHSQHDSELADILKKLSNISHDPYYASFSSELTQIISILQSISDTVHSESEKIELEKTIKNLLVSAISNYNEKVSPAATSKEREKRNFLDMRMKFINSIHEAIRINTENIDFPALPTIIQGYSSSPKRGFNFNSEAAYHGRDILCDFLTKMFTRQYASIDALKGITTTDELVSAINRCTEPSQIDAAYQRNLIAFLEEMCQCKNYIVDTTQGNEELGNTLGEMSLAYFKYMTAHETEHSIILIDQPEDHISNNNISQKLLRYFNRLRDKKQVIIVTHNPLLVVNQDVDQVLFVQKVNDRIKVISGCLEYEDEENSILDIIAKNMDGGKDSIEKRLKVYGKDN